MSAELCPHDIDTELELAPGLAASQDLRYTKPAMRAGTAILAAARYAPETIGQAVSSGSFRLVNDDVIDLYSRVNVGTKVIVRQD